jgi:hypothetical protein
MGTKQDNKTLGEDIVMIHGVDRDRNELHVLRRRRNNIEAAVVRPAREGMPLDGDLVRLKPRESFPMVCDVETLLELPAEARQDRGTRQGPPQVTTEAYRRGWEAVFGRVEPRDADQQPN